MKFSVAITFHYNEDKLSLLQQVLECWKKIPSQDTKITIVVNSPTPQQENLIKNLVSGLDINIYPVKRLYHPFFLAWVHKRFMLEFLKSKYTHFVYQEDDIAFTPASVRYWQKTRKLFLSHNLNLIPGHVVVEQNPQGDWYALHQTTVTKVGTRPQVVVGDKTYVSIRQPYQASYIMDKAMVEEHIISDSYRYETATPWGGAWLVQDMAAQGNTFVNVPQGWDHRVVIPLQHQDTWIHHLSNKYVNIPHSQHGKILANGIFEP